MRPLDLQVIGNQLAVKWPDDSETFLELETLRRRCPCATCQGERDVLGNLHKGPDRPLTRAAFELVRLENIGSYAIQPVWADGHATGIYAFEYLRKIAQ